MITKELLKLVLTEQRLNLLEKDAGIPRQVLDEIQAKIHLPHIHVITGIRRCGKSTLLRQIIKKYYNDENFYYVNFEDERLLNFDPASFNKVYEVLIELFGQKKTFFIDEIQHVREFDSFVRRFYDNGFKFFITGSNAGLLKEEISTRLTGRHIDTLLTPFSFCEYLELKTGDASRLNMYTTEDRAMILKWFSDYLVKGGMPEYSIYMDPEILRRIYDDIIVKDVMVRKKISNLYSLKELYLFLVSNFGQRFSYNSLQDIVPFGSVNTIRKYIHFLEETYLVRVINKFDFSVRKQLANDKKLYICDNGFIPLISTRAGIDRGWLLENLVLNNLPANHDLFYYSGKKETDFIVMENKKVVSAIQVTYELSAGNRNRELAGLIEALTITGLEEGLLLTNDQEEEIVTDSKTIRVKPVWKWLME
ncbi:MAG: ATP-binding protein [Bacteroidales bacterium]|nr:ATP-binding protein [Bacteroidales bacterium]